MKRAEKIAALTHLLQGNTTKLKAIKQRHDKRHIVFILDETPEGWFGDDMDDVPVKATYSLHHGEKVTEYLTRSQIRTIAKGIFTIIPNNRRLKGTYQ